MSFETAVRRGDTAAIRASARVVRRELATVAGRRDPLYRAEVLRSLGAIDLAWYDNGGGPAAVIRAFGLRTRALDLLTGVAPAMRGDPEGAAFDLALGECEADLAQALIYRYEIDDRLEWLDRAVTLLEAARDRSPDPELHDAVDGSLAVCLESRSRRTSSVADARRAEGLHRRVRDRSGADRVERALLTSNLANSLATVYELSGDPAAAVAAATEARAAAVAMPRTDQRTASLWSAYANILGLRLSQDSDPALIGEAVRAGRQGVRLAHDGDPGLGGYLLNLVNLLLLEHDATGDPDPLHEAVEQARQAVRVTPPGSPGGAPVRSALASALRTRYDSDGDHATLREALRFDRQAVADSAPGDAGRPSYLNNLAITLFTLYEHERDPGLLEEAERAAEAAVTAAGDSGADRHLLLQTLARVLFIRHQHTGAIAPLHRAADLDRRALRLIGPGSAGWTETAGNLAADLIAVHQAASNVAALTEAAGLLERAVAHTGPGTAGPAGPSRPDLARNLFNLGVALAGLAAAGEGPATEDRVAAVAALRAAAALASAPATLRAEAAMEWGQVAAAAGDWATASEGFALAIELLPLVSPRRLNRRDQELRIGVFDGLARDAAASVLAAEHPDPARAVELLDRGRGVLLAPILEETDDLARVRSVDPSLAERFVRLRAALDADPVGVGGGRARERLAADLAGVIAEIRARPGLSGFLVAPGIDSLRAAAADGPVVLLNISEYRSDALLVTADTVRSVPLPLVTPARTAEVVRAYLAGLARPGPVGDSRLRAVCGWLWDAVAEPVLRALDFGARDGGWPRLWWCPAGALGMLPLHAAGRWDPLGGEDDGVLDRVVSSYTATVRTLAAVRSRASGDPGRPLLVALSSGTPGAPDLPHVEREIEAVRRAAPTPPAMFLGPQARRAAVLAALGRHAWLHFAGHSSRDADDPGRGRLRLSDGDLTATEIAALRLTGAQFAYVSSCDGAAAGPSLPDEPLHLALALQLSGFRHVVAASRPVGDRSAADIAAAFYRGLTAGERFEPAGAAEALHDAVRALRRTHPPAVWAPYLHAGP
ncbi:CHAT domain-containing protein [Dactylosporangium sp. CA-092794]|uniref:CHAT domain-containing protein n=1 Tax=Dactylosporangium sp. CA-092794 TaxID=3239929 RepID=UPI003D92BB0F